MLSSAVVLFAALFGGPSDDDLVIDQAVLTLIESADVPSQEAGPVDRWLVKEGTLVLPGQPLVKLDDRQSQLAFERASLEFAAARHLAKDTSKVDSARKTAEKEQQGAIEAQVSFDVAQTEALNDIAVRASAKSRDVADNEYQRALRSRESSKNSVSESTLDGMRLEFEKASLSHEQAQFQQSILKMKLDAQRAAVRTQTLAVESAELTVQEAESLLTLARLQADLKHHDVETARQALARRTVLSPIEGVVVELPRRAGEWVQPGEKVARVIRLSRLRAEGFIPLARASQSLVGRPARVELTNSSGTVHARTGTVTFVSPDVDPINQEVRLWVEFDNPDGQLLPGLRATLRIPPAAPATAASR